MANLKWLGAILILVAATWTGFYFSRQLNGRPRQIRQFIDALTVLEAEMLYSQLPLPLAFLQIARRVQAPLDHFFHTLSEKIEMGDREFIELWEEQLNRLAIDSPLREVDLQILYQFGQTLGQHDYEQQEKNIRLTISYLQGQREEAVEEARRLSKLANIMGLLLGLLIVLLLI